MPRLSHRTIIVGGSLLGALLAIAAVVLAVARVPYWAGPAVASSIVLVSLAAWVLAGQRDRRLRTAVDQGMQEIETLLIACSDHSRVQVGGVAELCPACGRPVDPCTARCAWHRPWSRANWPTA